MEYHEGNQSSQQEQRHSQEQDYSRPDWGTYNYPRQNWTPSNQSLVGQNQLSHAPSPAVMQQVPGTFSHQNQMPMYHAPHLQMAEAAMSNGYTGMSIFQGQSNGLPIVSSQTSYTELCNRFKRSNENPPDSAIAKRSLIPIADLDQRIQRYIESPNVAVMAGSSVASGNSKDPFKDPLFMGKESNIVIVALKNDHTMGKCIASAYLRFHKSTNQDDFALFRPKLSWAILNYYMAHKSTELTPQIFEWFLKSIREVMPLETCQLKSYFDASGNQNRGLFSTHYKSLRNLLDFGSLEGEKVTITLKKSKNHAKGELDLEQKMTRLKKIVEVNEETKALWIELRHLHQSVMTCQFKNISTFCNYIPALKTKNGYELIIMDFHQDYPECLKNLCQRWQILCPKIHDIVQTRIKKSGKTTRDYNDMDSWQKTLNGITEDFTAVNENEKKEIRNKVQSTIGWLVFPLIYNSQSVPIKEWKNTYGRMQFVDFIQCDSYEDGEEIQKIIQDHWAKVKRHEKIVFEKYQQEKTRKAQEGGAHPQVQKPVTKKSTRIDEKDKFILPHVIIVGRNFHEAQSHVVVTEELYYTFDDVTTAVDVTFKIIYGLNQLWSHRRLATQYGRDVPHLWQLVQYITGAKCTGMGSQYSCQAKILNVLDPNREIFIELATQAVESEN